MFTELFERLDTEREDPKLLRELFREIYWTVDEFLLDEAGLAYVPLHEQSDHAPGQSWEEAIPDPAGDFTAGILLQAHVAELMRDLSLDQRELLERVYWLEQPLYRAAHQMGLSALEFDTLHAAALARLRFLWGGE